MSQLQFDDLDLMEPFRCHCSFTKHRHRVSTDFKFRFLVYTHQHELYQEHDRGLELRPATFLDQYVSQCPQIGLTQSYLWLSRFLQA